MKKILITLSIITGVLIVLAIGIAVFVPGLPIYIIYKDKFPNAHIQLEEFSDYNLLFDSSTETKIIEFEGVTAELPDDYYRRNEESTMLASYVCDDSDELFAICAPEQQEFDLVENTVELAEKKGMSEKEALRFFTSLGIEPPETLFDFLYATQSLTWESFNIRSFTASMSFVAIALGKESFISIISPRERYYYENEQFKGFIFVNEHRENPELNHYICDFFYANDGNESFIVIMDVQDEETAWAFINSIRVDG